MYENNRERRLSSNCSIQKKLCHLYLFDHVINWLQPITAIVPNKRTKKGKKGKFTARPWQCSRNEYWRREIVPRYCLQCLLCLTVQRFFFLEAPVVKPFPDFSLWGVDRFPLFAGIAVILNPQKLGRFYLSTIVKNRFTVQSNDESDW